jgi:hypothetical protein
MQSQPAAKSGRQDQSLLYPFLSRQRHTVKRLHLPANLDYGTTASSTVSMALTFAA